MADTPKAIFFVLLACCQFCMGYSSEENVETAEQSSLSRAKRAKSTYDDMMRYGRGLHMLRLGKRGGYSSDENTQYLNELLSLAEAYGGQYSPYNEPYSSPYYEGHYDSPDMIGEGQVQSYGRFKRSTPDSDEARASEYQKFIEQGQITDQGVPLYEMEQFLIPKHFRVPREFSDLSGDAASAEADDKFGFEKRQLPMLRLGKRSLGMLRLGKREPKDEEEKRSLGMLRLGKRQLTMLRLGKRSLGMLRLGKRLEDGKKRSLGMLRLGKRLDDDYTDEEKRSLGMLRLGKRQLTMLRLGKKSLGMLRLGKKDFEEDKKSLGMLRLGRRDGLSSSLSEESPEKRPMSMLRLGKRKDEEKRSLGMLRLGKRSDV